MKIIHFVPGVVATPTVFAIPATAPGIDTIGEVLVLRLPQGVSAHAVGAALAHAATAVAVGHANADVDPHAAHSHTFASQGLGGAVTLAIGLDVVPAANQLEDAGAAALHTFTADNTTGILDFVTAAHVVTQPDNHTGADILAAVDDHAQADVAAALADHTAVAPALGAVVATRDTARTIHLDTSTEVHDIVILSYHEVGARVPVS